MYGFNKNTRQVESSQGYLVSVGDMMSGLLFIFIITLMVFAINFHIEKTKKEREAKKLVQIQEQKDVETKKLIEIQKQKDEQTERLKRIQKQLIDAKSVRKELLEDLKESLKKNGVIVRIDVDKGLLRVPEAILFESGKAEFQEGGKETLEKLAKNLAERLPCYSGKRSDKKPDRCLGKRFKPGRLEAVLVEGHTDNVSIKGGKYDDNWDLSAKRSIVTYRHILEVNPEMGNLLNSDDESLLGVSGYADTRPVIKHDKETPEPFNRRIDLRFIVAPPPPEAAFVDDERTSG